MVSYAINAIPKSRDRNERQTLWAALGADIKGVSNHIPFNPQGEAMIRKTLLPFKLERTDETLIAHGGLNK